MSEAGQDRTEQASPRKRQQAHDKGQVARSADLTTAMLLLGAALSLRVAGPPLARTLTELYTSATLYAPYAPTTVAGATGWLRSLARPVFIATAGMMALTCSAGVLMAAAQARGVLSLKPLLPDWSRISPRTNLPRVLGKQSLVELLKSVFKLIVIAAALQHAVRAAWAQVTAVGQQSPSALLHAITSSSIALLATAGGAFLLIAGADYGWQWWQHEQQLRMTREEVKQESKESEGDPQLKARQRTIARSRLRRQMFDQVPQADVVVTNPTRIAVALRYDVQRAGAPIVLAMGERKIAQRIRELALASGVPVIENKPLARALLATARVGEPIPMALYVAVAEVLAFVIRRTRARADAWRGPVTV